MSTQNPGRHGAAYWRARKEVLRHATHCALCGGEFNPDAPPKSRWSKSVDHIIPLSDLTRYDPAERHRLSVDPSNMRPAHLICNSKRGAHTGGRAWVEPAPVADPTPETDIDPDLGPDPELHPDVWRNPRTGRWASADWDGTYIRNKNWAAHVAAGGMKP
jgi:hypothetical protein